MVTLAIIGQVLFGLYWLSNGFNHFNHLNGMAGYASSKGVVNPRFAVRLTGLLLLIGGLGILLGYQIWWAILALVVFLILVSFKMHNFWAMTDPQMKMMEYVQFTKNMALLGALLMLWTLPVWPYSLI